MGLHGNESDTLIAIGISAFPHPYNRGYVGKTLNVSSDLEFDEHPDHFFYPPVVKITRVSINANQSIHALHLSYLLLDGTVVEGGIHGRPSEMGKTSNVDIGETEFLYDMDMNGNSSSVNWFRFSVHNDKDEKDTTHGPFGVWNGNMSTYAGAKYILGISGMAENTLEGLCIYRIVVGESRELITGQSPTHRKSNQHT